MRVPSLVLAVAAGLLAAVPATAGAAVQTERVLVTASSASALPEGARFVSELAPGLRAYTLPTPDGVSATRYAASLSTRPGVFAAQPDRHIKMSGLAQTCADAPSANDAQKLVNAVGAGAVAAPPTTGPVAILDTGVDPATAELRGRVLPGFNAATGTTDTTDLDGHGTEVAAVAASKPGRFQGTSPTSPILPITVYNRSSETTVAWVVRGIEEAVKRGAAVINLSSSNPAADVSTSDAAVLDQAITAAFAQGVITVVSSGNEGKGDAAVPGNLTRVLNVGSATAEGSRDAFSNYGPWIDLMSPGANLILPASPGLCESGYGIASGTSFSAPAVAGATALIKSERSDLNAQGLFDVMRTGAVKDLYNAGRDDDSGFGLLDVSAGLNSPAPVKQPTEVDDDVFWLKQDPKNHPTYLTKARTAKIKSAFAVGKDPQDVYKVALKRGQTLTASADSKQDVATLGLWRPTTGSFDIGKGRTTFLIDDSQGATKSPQVSYRVTKTGTYYVSVEAPDLPDPKDPNTADQTFSGQSTYTLNLRATKTPKKKAKAKKKSKKR